jgi:hypothetical protein
MMARSNSAILEADMNYELDSEILGTRFPFSDDEYHENSATSFGEFLKATLLGLFAVTVIGGGTYLAFVGLVFALTIVAR